MAWHHRLFFTGFMLLLSGVAAAEVYKWTDSQGRVHYGDKPPEQQTTQSVQVGPQPALTPPPQPQRRPLSWKEQLSKAIETNDEVGAMTLLSRAGTEQFTIEHVVAAVKTGHANLFGRMFEKRALVDASVFSNMQIFVEYALLNGRLNVYRKLKQFDVVVLNADTLLEKCFHQELFESTEALLADGANADMRNGSLLRLAIQNRDIKWARLLLQYGANPNLKPTASHLDAGLPTDKFSHPALWRAVDLNKLALAKLLLDAGADPNLSDSIENETPLDHAERRRLGDMAALLLQYGAKNGPNGRARKQQQAMDQRSTDYQRQLREADAGSTKK
ncbi:MAG: DUF4124 domain-containing protein [Pseudomonadota bacterium]